MDKIEMIVNLISALAFIFLLLTHRKTTADAVKQGLDKAQAVTAELTPLVDGTPLAKYANLLELIEKAAAQGVQFAQQLWREDPTTDRAQTATTYVHDAMTELGVDVSDGIKRVIDGAIKAAVYVLKSSDPESEPAEQPSTALPEHAPIPAHVQQLMDAAQAYTTTEQQAAVATNTTITTG